MLKMQTMKKLILIPAMIVAACSIKTKTETATAAIFERKIMPNGKLMLLYAFNSRAGIIKDSIITETNKVITDSITVKYSPENPAEKEVIIP